MRTVTGGGGVLPPANDDCATKVCATDPFCCSGQWDASCVTEAKNPAICPTGGLAPNDHFTCACAHSYCAAGVALQNLCDPCVKRICELDSFCCTNQWDVNCVAETHSVCQIPAAPNCK